MVKGLSDAGLRVGMDVVYNHMAAAGQHPQSVLDRIVPGNALAVDRDMPFSSLTRFGTEFLNKFQASVCNSPVLEKVFFVDTPGVLSGEKQKSP